MYCQTPFIWDGKTHPCRKCRPCRNWRSYQWQYRLKQEHLASCRTWFCTWTSSSVKTEPEWKHSWQKFMKRLRRRLTRSRRYPAARLRYFTVMESGSLNSRLHLHSLMFCSAPITKRDIEHSWKAGFSRLTLMKQTDLRYVTKYALKENFRLLTSHNLGLLTSSAELHPPWYTRKALPYRQTHQEP